MPSVLVAVIPLSVDMVAYAVPPASSEVLDVTRPFRVSSLFRIPGSIASLLMDVMHHFPAEGVPHAPL